MEPTPPPTTTEFARIKRILWLILGAILLQTGYSNTPFSRSEFGALIAVALVYAGLAIPLVLMVRGIVLRFAQDMLADRDQPR